MKTYLGRGLANKYGKKSAHLTPYVWSILMAIALTVLMTPLKSSLGLVNIAMIYLMPVLIASSRWGKAPAFAAAAAGILSFDFFFVHPVGTLTVSDARYLITFGIFLLVGIITGTLSAKLKTEAANSRQGAAKVAALYSLSRDIAAVTNLDSVLKSVTRNIADTVEGEVVVFLPDDTGKLGIRAISSLDIILNDREKGAATGVFKGERNPDKGTTVLNTLNWAFLPLETELGMQGVLGFRTQNRNQAFNLEKMQLLEAFAGLTAMAVNRVKLAEQARQAQTLIESEQLRTALFNSLSHDLRTPLSSIIGAVTGLLEDDIVYTPEARRELLVTIKQGATTMHRFISNLLDMARLESGMLALKKEWCDIQDIVGVVVNQFESLRTRPLQITLEPGLPLIKGDFILIQQILVNLLDNALKYSEPETPICLSASKTDDKMKISVSDQGLQIPAKDLPKIFDKFYRLKSPQRVSGTGLGLSICKGIVEAHGGNIWVENNPAKGVTISFVLPLSKDYPGNIHEIDEGDTYGINRG